MRVKRGATALRCGCRRSCRANGCTGQAAWFGAVVGPLGCMEACRALLEYIACLLAHVRVCKVSKLHSGIIALSLWRATFCYANKSVPYRVPVPERWGRRLTMSRLAGSS